MKTTLTCATITYLTWAAFPNFGTVVNALALPIFICCLMFLAAVGVGKVLHEGSREMPPMPTPPPAADASPDEIAAWGLRAIREIRAEQMSVTLREIRELPEVSG